MKYHTTKPELFYTSNRGDQYWFSCSYPEKNKPSFMMEMWNVFEYVDLYPKETCEIWHRFWELIYEKEEWVRQSIQKVLPELEKDYQKYL
jgi:hypothetical protein